MNSFQIALLVGAIITMRVAWRLPRAALWIMVGATDFAATTAYARYGLPNPTMFTLGVDAAVCVSIFFIGKRAWEFPGLYLVFQGMVLASLLNLAGLIGTHWSYVALLELLNWIGLAIIGGTAVLQWIDANGMDSDRLGLVHRSSLALRRKRTGFPFASSESR